MRTSPNQPDAMCCVLDSCVSYEYAEDRKAYYEGVYADAGVGDLFSVVVQTSCFYNV